MLRSLGRVVTVVMCVATLGVAQAATVALPAGAGGVPEEDQGDVPKVEGITIVANYRYEGMPFFEGGFILKQPQLENFVSIDCGPNGAVNPVGGPDGAPECGYHPAVTEATVTITGKLPWFEIASSFVLVPYWSFDDKTYVKGDPITLKAPKAGKVTQEHAGQTYLDIGTTVNLEVAQVVGTIEAWNDKTTGAQAVADLANLDEALDDAKKDLKGLQKDYPPAKKTIKKQLKAIKALQADITAAGGLNDGVDLTKWKVQFNEHLADLSDASNNVRAKLGLPAVDAGDSGGLLE